jgi:hypothetical protein
MSRAFAHGRGRRSLGLIAGLLILAAATAGRASTNSSREVRPSHLVSPSQTPSIATLLGAVNSIYAIYAPLHGHLDLESLGSAHVS